MNSLEKSLSSRTRVPRQKQLRRDKMRNIKDGVFRYIISTGGIGVIFAIVLIFVYLLSVVYPIFNAADINYINRLDNHSFGKTLRLSTEEQFEIGTRITDQGNVIFFHLADGSLIDNVRLKLPVGTRITSFANIDLRTGWFAFGLDNGSALVAATEYESLYIDNRRLIEPRVTYPLGEEPLVVSDSGSALQQITVADNEETLTLVAKVDDGLALSSYTKVERFSDDELSVESEANTVIPWFADVFKMLITPEQRTLYVLDKKGSVSVHDIVDKQRPTLTKTLSTLPQGVSVVSAEFLLGGISLLIADSRGKIGQLFPARDANGIVQLQPVRVFDGHHPVSGIVAEQRRKGFYTFDDKGRISIYHTTANRHIETKIISKKPLMSLAVSPRGNGILAEDSDGKINVWSVKNEHPDVSWQALWHKVWYESFEKPEFLWQSSASNNDFEPKFSLSPLTFGTLKAAFYAMLFAVPLSILGAIYTAYFMSPGMRKAVKPTIEVMEALPTVILGFLAGLWLAPFMEKNLLGVMLVFPLIAVAILAFGFAWSRMPSRLQQYCGNGSYAALLIPVVIIATQAALMLGVFIETDVMGVATAQWLDSHGITFDQRNAMVVGFAMGFAVIPTIFSISEDAIFGVPKSLTFGSLALGATPWQTLSRVVILTASPGIFSAIMIGLGRAVGETMIVLMATGNTPIMDFNIFEGMRTLSANIAVEMPESELGSSHYRILFLAALVLFIVTFAFNTIAEIVRQRMREKYSNL